MDEEPRCVSQAWYSYHTVAWGVGGFLCSLVQGSGKGGKELFKSPEEVKLETVSGRMGDQTQKKALLRCLAS